MISKKYKRKITNEEKKEIKATQNSKVTRANLKYFFLK